MQPQPQRAPLPREPAVVAVTPALAKDPPPAPSLSPLPPSTTSLSPRPPQTTTSTPPSPLPKPVQEHIRRLGPNEPRSELTLDVQYQIVDTLLKKKDMKEGEGWYLVSSKWWNSWVKACNNAKDPALGAAGIRYTMNPIDNTDLWDSSQNTLRKGLGCLAVEYLGRINGPFFVVVPREVWEVCLGPWCGIFPATNLSSRLVSDLPGMANPPMFSYGLYIIVADGVFVSISSLRSYHQHPKTTSGKLERGGSWSIV